MADPVLDPGPNGDPEDVLKFLATLTDEQAAKWMSSNINRMPARNVTMVEERLRLQSNLDESVEDPDPATDLGTNSKTLGAIEDTYDSRKQEIDRQRAIDDASQQLQDEQGLDKETADKQAEDLIAEAAGQSRPVPELIKGYTGGLKPSTAQQQNLVDAWNEFNPDAEVDSFDQFVEITQERQNEPLVKQIVDAAFTGTEPQTIYEWTYSGVAREDDKGRTDRVLRLNENEFAALKTIYGDGFTTKDIQKLGKIAADINLNQVVGGQPGWQILAAGAAAMGMWNIGTRDEDNKKLVPTTSRAGSLAGKSLSTAEIKKRQSLTSTEINRLRNWGVQFKTGMNQYGNNDSLAFLHAMDQPLAAKVATTKFEKLTLDDRRRAFSYMQEAGFSQQNLEALGYGWAAGFENEGVNAPQDAGAGAGRIRMVPDKDAIRQATKDLYIQLFRADPTDEELDRFTNQVSGVISGAAETQSVDGQAQIRKTLEADPQYGELYGKKPGGMSEQEYANQFDNAAASILGNQAADPNNIRSGMRNGQYQTTVGAAAGSKEAQNNSTWLGRLATAAQLVSENT